MRFLVLGPLEVCGADGTVALGGRRQRAVLAALLLNRDRRVPTDRLVDLVWGEQPPPSASGTLQAYVSRLRGALGGDAISFDAGGYALTVPDETVDAARFEALVAEGDAAVEAADHALALDRYTEALGLWRGERLFGELGEEAFALADAARLEGLRLHTLEGRFGAALELGQGAAVLPDLEAAVHAHPYREVLSGQLMVALYRAGRQVEALAAFRRTARRLREEIGVDPGAELRELERRMLAQDPTLEQRAVEFERQSRAANPTNLRPFASTFLGRDDELARLEEVATRQRLVTVTGPGGVGKTRLAVELGWRLLDATGGGVWDVDLATESDGGGVERAIARALGIPERSGLTGVEQVALTVADRPLVLLVDNCEHVLADARGVVDALLGRCSRLRVVATSREPLGAAEEAIFALEPLPLPDVVADVDVLRRSPAVRLFEERAATVHRGFRVTAANAASVARIVRRVDGIPLAVELAAGTVGLHTPRELANMLADGLPPLADEERDPRHATLRSTIGWSYERLTESERRLLGRLAVFAGPFTAAAAVEVCASEDLDADAVPALLERLVRRSLVAPPVPHGRDGQPRHRLLELVRHYLVERLERAGELEVHRRRHVAHLRGLAERAAAALHGPDQAQWYDRLRSEDLELGRGLATAVELGADHDLVALVRCLWLWWYLDARTREALAWLDRAVVAAEDDAARAELLAASSLVRAEHEGSDRGRAVTALGDRALAVADNPGRPAVLATVQLLVGDAMTAISDYDRAEGLLIAAADHFHEEGPLWAEGWAVLRLVRVDGFRGADIEAAMARLALAVDLLRRAGEVQLLAYAQLIRSTAAWYHGDFHAAIDEIRPAVTRYGELGFDGPLAEALTLEAQLLMALGRQDAAGRRLEEVAGIAERTGSAVLHTIVESRRAALCTQRGALDEARLILERELAERRANHDELWVAEALWTLVPVLSWLGDRDRAAELAAELEVLPYGVSAWFRIRAELAFAEVRLARAERDEAETSLRAVEDLTREVGQLTGRAAALEGLAVIAQLDGDVTLATRRLAAAAALRDASGARPPAPVADRNAAIIRWARRSLGRGDFVLAWSKGTQEADPDVVRTRP